MFEALLFLGSVAAGAIASVAGFGVGSVLTPLFTLAGFILAEGHASARLLRVFRSLFGWIPGGSQILVAREAIGEGKHKRNFELLRLDTLATVRQAADPGLLGAFKRWQDPSWKQNTLSMR